MADSLSFLDVNSIFSTAERYFFSVTNYRNLLNRDFGFFFGWILGLWLVRVILLKALVSLSRSKYAENYRITKKPVISPKQLERESVWPWGYFYDTVAFVIIYALGFLHNLPIFDYRGIFYQLLWHALVVEPLYYLWHRLLHVQWLYKNYHQYHHKSINTEPTTGLSFEFGERISYTLLFAVPIIGADWNGVQSYFGIALFLIWFDIMNEGGHINFEVLPNWLIQSPFTYVFYFPTFHSIHHTKFKKNYCLFMPYTDVLFGTAVYDASNLIAPTSATQVKYQLPPEETPSQSV